MAKMYDQVLKETKVACALANRQEALSALSLSLTKLDKLEEQETFKVSTFKRLVSEVEVRIDQLRGLQTAFHRLILLSEPRLQGSDEVNKDLSNIEDLIDSCYEKLDQMKGREDLKAAFTEVKPDQTPHELSDILVTLQKNQSEQIETLVKSMSEKQNKAMESMSEKQNKAIASITKNNYRKTS